MCVLRHLNGGLLDHRGASYCSDIIHSGVPVSDSRSCIHKGCIQRVHKRKYAICN